MNKKQRAEAEREQQIQKLIVDLNVAETCACNAYQENDGGTCNFDKPLILLDKWKPEHISKVNEAFGRQIIGDKMDYGFYKHYRMVMTTMYGQAMCRTKMAEAAYQSLKADGHEVVMYYQMD